MVNIINESCDLPTLISVITQALAETDDFTVYDAETSSGNALYHTPSQTYFSMYLHGSVCITSDNGTRPSGGRFPGVVVTFSTEWNSDTHEPSGQIYRGVFCPYDSNIRNNYANINRLVLPYVFSCNFHIDKYGFIGTIQNTNQNGLGNFIACEFFPQSWLEFDHGQKPIVFLVRRTADSYDYTGFCEDLTQLPDAVDDGVFYLIPYHYKSGTLAGGHYGNFIDRRAYRSEGNNKVYLNFPWYEDGVQIGRRVIAQTRRWFHIEISGGISVGDTINWIDPDDITVHKYLVVMATAGNFYYAIPYENPFDYAIGAKR